jgi:microcin C transport system permease protein
MSDTLSMLPRLRCAATCPSLPPRPRWLAQTLADQPARLNNFKANKRGWWSLWLFLTLFVLSLFAEFIANDRPLIVRYKGEWLFPTAVNYPGGEVRRLPRNDGLPRSR